MNWKHFCRVLVFIFLLSLIQNSAEATALVKRNADPNGYQEKFHGGYFDHETTATKAFFTVAESGSKKKENDQQHEQQILYLSAGDDQDVRAPYGKFETGLHRASGNMDNVFGKWGGRRDANYETKFLYGGAEVGNGAMVRAGLADATVNTGPFAVNIGASVDTGAMIYKDGLEVKLGGIGGKVTAKGIQGCFVICFGVNW